MTTDYTTFPLSYRLKKVARYVTLYGISRTLTKIDGQYHMRKTGAPLESDWRNPAVTKREGRDVAIIGCGNFGYSNIGYYCSKVRPRAILCAYDPVGERAKSLVRRYKGEYAAADPIEAIRNPAVRIVFVASNHASHADYAVEAVKQGKTVHIEKPHVVSRSQLQELVDVCKSHPEARIFLGFNRPRSAHFGRLQKAFRSEPGPAMISWFVAGHALDSDHWYFSEAEGGRILGNLCHWTDLTLRLVGLQDAYPIRITGLKPKDSESDYAVSLIFGDGSVGVLAFSAKGHTFEGVREYLNAHKGNVLASIMDFHRSSLDIGEHKWTYKTWQRDHGHRAAIEAALKGAEPESFEMMAESANLFLGIREAVDSGRPILLERIWQ